MAIQLNSILIYLCATEMSVTKSARVRNKINTNKVQNQGDLYNFRNNNYIRTNQSY
jgi:hypothetical protein